MLDECCALFTEMNRMILWPIHSKFQVSKESSIIDVISHFDTLYTKIPSNRYNFVKTGVKLRHSKDRTVYCKFLLSPILCPIRFGCSFAQQLENRLRETRNIRAHCVNRKSNLKRAFPFSFAGISSGIMDTRSLHGGCAVRGKRKGSCQFA